MQTTTATKPESKGHVAPIHSPNEFHLGPNGEMISGLGHTQYPAIVKTLTAQDLANLAEREEVLANAESVLEGLKAAALVQIEQDRKQLEDDRAEFEREKAAALKKAGR